MKINEGVFIEVIGPKDMVLRYLRAICNFEIPMPMRSFGGGPLPLPLTDHISAAAWRAEDAEAVREWLKREGAGDG